MNKIFAIVSLIILSISLHAQVVISGQAIDQNGNPLPFAKVRVCPVTSTGTPCTPTASLYLDYSLTIPVANSYTADQYGNYSVYAPYIPSAPSFYVVQLTPISGVTWSYIVSGGFSLSTSNLLGGTLGSIPYQSSPNITTFLSPNITNSRKFIVEQGTGSVGSPPFLDSIQTGDVLSPVTSILSSPPPIGSTTANSGSFSNVSIGQTINIGISSYSQALSAITSCGSNVGCEFHVTGQVILGANLTLPANSVWYFEGGYFNVPTGITLNVNNSTFIAPPVQVITGSGTTTGLIYVEPEWLGPGSTIEAAAATLSTTAVVTVYLQSTTTAYIASGTTITNVSGIRIIGVGMPQRASDYSHFISGTGTIIKGTIAVNTSNVQLRYFGVDDGSTYASCANGIAVSSGGIANPLLHNIDIEHVATTLCSPTDAHHNILVEGGDRVTLRNLDVAEGTLGVVIKSTNVDFSDIKCFNTQNGCVYIKSDNTFAKASTINGRGVNSSGTAPAGGGGVTFEAISATLSEVNLTGLNITNVKTGIQTLPSGTGESFNDISISNMTVDNSAICVNLASTNRVTVSNFHCNNNTDTFVGSFDAFIVASTSTQTKIADGHFTNTMFNAVNTNGSLTEVNNVECSGVPAGSACVVATAQQVEVHGITTGSGVTALATASGGSFTSQLPANAVDVKLQSISDVQTVTFPHDAAGASDGTCLATVTCTPSYGVFTYVVGVTTTGDQITVHWTTGWPHTPVCTFIAFDITTPGILPQTVQDVGPTVNTAAVMESFSGYITDHTIQVTYHCK